MPIKLSTSFLVKVLVLSILSTQHSYSKPKSSPMVLTETELYNKVCAPQLQDLESKNKFEIESRKQLLSQLEETSQKLKGQSFIEYAKQYFENNHFDLSKTNSETNAKEAITLEYLQDINENSTIVDALSKNLEYKESLSIKQINSFKKKATSLEVITATEVESFTQQLMLELTTGLKNNHKAFAGILSSFCRYKKDKDYTICKTDNINQLQYSLLKRKASDINIINKTIDEYVALKIENFSFLKGLKLYSNSPSELMASLIADTSSWELKDLYQFDDIKNVLLSDFIKSLSQSKTFIEIFLRDNYSKVKFKPVYDRFNYLKQKMISYLNKVSLEQPDKAPYIAKIIKNLETIKLLELTSIPQKYLSQVNGIEYLDFAKLNGSSFWLSFESSYLESLYSRFEAYYLNKQFANVMFENNKSDVVVLGLSFMKKALENTKYTDLVLLHEIAHSMGDKVSDMAGYLPTTSKVFGNVWNCLNGSLPYTLGTDESFSDWLALEVLMHELDTQDQSSFKAHYEIAVRPFCSFLVEPDLGLDLGVHPSSILRIEEILGAHPNVVEAYNLTEEKNYCKI